MSSKFNVRKMAEALQKGAVMMAIHCDHCGAPLFRFKTGRIECVNCGRLYRLAGTEAVEEVSPVDYLRDEAVGVMRELETLILSINDEAEIKNVIKELRRLREKLTGTIQK
ncbi:MAG: Sjogren's syndrome/scleroderma autoantigen 1 family protein [Thermoproteota archaeon]